jgi:hypothetical protein
MRNGDGARRMYFCIKGMHQRHVMAQGREETRSQVAQVLYSLLALRSHIPEQGPSAQQRAASPSSPLRSPWPAPRCVVIGSLLLPRKARVAEKGTGGHDLAITPVRSRPIGVSSSAGRLGNAPQLM